MNNFRWPFDSILTRTGKDKDFVATGMVVVSFFVIVYLMAIFTDEYKYAKDFTSSHPKLVRAVGGDPQVFLDPFNYKVRKSSYSTAHYEFFIFGSKAKGSAVVDLETQDGFWKIKSANFTAYGGQLISLELEDER